METLTLVFFVSLIFSYFSLRGLTAEIMNKKDYKDNFWLMYLPTICLWTVFYYLNQ